MSQVSTKIQQCAIFNIEQNPQNAFSQLKSINALPAETSLWKNQKGPKSTSLSCNFCDCIHTILLKLTGMRPHFSQSYKVQGIAYSSCKFFHYPHKIYSAAKNNSVGLLYFSGQHYQDFQCSTQSVKSHTVKVIFVVSRGKQSSLNHTDNQSDYMN